MRCRPLLVLFPLMLTVSFTPVLAKKKPLSNLTLQWAPTTKVGELGLGAIDLTALQGVRVEVGAFTDARSGPPELIGENREDADDGVVLPVSTADSVPEFCRGQLRRFLSELGLPIVDSGGTVVLTAEVTELKVVEESTYVGSVLLNVAVRDASGSLRWKGVVTGSAKRFGRSYSAENYNETLSDALLDADAVLARSQEFLAALRSTAGSQAVAPAPRVDRQVPAPISTQGTKPSAGSEAERLSNQDIVALAASGLGDSIILAKIQQAPAEGFDVSVDALVALKKKGVSQPVIEAMIRRSEARSATPPSSGGSATNPSGMPVGSSPVASSTGADGRPHRPGEVTLYFTDRPAGHYRELGRVSAQKYNLVGISRKRGEIDADLKKEAAKLGANAVINITEDFAGVSGVAVVLTE
ncbi:MAG: hypothetical protein IPJ17_09210 [Holophagales bacterium]|nr:MAG: hypothetical protein IPJ17_09210 [Holophagales bacterium]